MELPVAAFPFLSAEELSELLPAMKSVAVDKGGELFHVGDAADGVYFLETGRLAVLKATGFNDRTQVVALLEPGASVGEGGALKGSSRTATIVAIEESRLCRLGRDSLEAFGEKNPSLLIKLLERLLYVANLRLQKSSERLAHIL